MPESKLAAQALNALFKAQSIGTQRMFVLIADVAQPITRAELCKIMGKRQFNPSDKKRLKRLVELGFVVRVRRDLVQQIYIGRDGTALKYGAPFEWVYHVPPQLIAARPGAGRSPQPQPDRQSPPQPVRPTAPERRLVAQQALEQARQSAEQERRMEEVKRNRQQNAGRESLALVEDRIEELKRLSREESQRKRVNTLAGMSEEEKMCARNRGFDFDTPTHIYRWDAKQNKHISRVRRTGLLGRLLP